MVDFAGRVLTESVGRCSSDRELVVRDLAEEALSEPVVMTLCVVPEAGFGHKSRHFEECSGYT